jgi:gliding motility-associated-like protein
VSQVTASTYDVQISGGDMAGLNAVVGLNFSSPTITDLAGNALPNTEPTTDQTYTLDNIAPSTTSFTRKTPTTENTNADAVTFLVTFSEDVTGVDNGDFAVTGATGASISVSQVTASTYDVQISGGDMATFNGTVALNFSSPSITDLAGNALPNTEPTTDQTYTLDNAAPSTTSFTRKTPTAENTNADAVTFLVTFSEDVTGVDNGDFGVTGATGVTISVSQVTASTYDVQISGGDMASLNAVVGLNFNSPSITDLIGNALPNTEPTTDETYNVDNAAPSATSFTRKTPTNENTSADAVTFLVTFSEDVTGVDLNDFEVTGPTGASISVSQVTASTYDVQVSGGDMATFNGTVALNFNSPSITDLAGNALPNTEPATDQTYTLDNTAPSTVSFTRKTPTSQFTNADAVTFLVTFSKEVTGVDLNDFAVTGPTGASISVSQVTASTYDVQISGGNMATFNGTVALNFNSPSITDLSSNPLPNTEPTTDETYTLDNIAPSTTSFTRKTPTAENTNANTVTFLVTFSEDVTGVDNADFTVTGPTGASISVSQVTASTYDVQISGGDMASLDATVALNFSSPSITDLAGNALPNTEPTTDETYNVDNAAPSTVSFTRKTPTAQNTSADAVTFLVTFSEDVTGVDLNDFEVTGPTGATVSVSQVTASTYDVQVSGGDMAAFNGIVALNFNSPSITDLTGNALPNTEPTTDETYNVDNTAPSTTSFTRKTPADQLTNADAVTFLVTFSEDVTGVGAADFAVTGPTGAGISVVQVSPSTYDVQVSGGDMAGLNGTVSLSFNSPSITDLAGNALPNTAPSTNQTYTLDNTAPATVSFTRKTPATATTSADQVTYLATFSEDVTSVGTADFGVSGTTAGITSVTQVTASTYDVVVSGGDLATLNGAITLDVATGVAITDLAGNALPTGEPATDQTYTFCNGPNNQVTTLTLGTVTDNSLAFVGFTAPAGGATGYVIKINTSNSFTTPADGTTLPTASTAWANSGEQVVYAGPSTTPNITVTGLTPGTTYHLKVFAYNLCSGTNTFESVGATTNTTTAKGNQTITFGALADKQVGDAPFDLTATASSGLAVTYTSSNTAVATISGSTVTIVGVGTTNITASQAGNANYNAATDVVQTLTVNKGDQTITFGALADRQTSDAPFELTATASSGLVVTYTSSNPAVATVSGTTVTIVGVGTTNITASQAGDANYNAAADVVQPLNVVNLPNMEVQEGTNAIASGGTYSFGSIDVGSSSNRITFTITNSGGADLQLSGNPIVEISGANSSEFAVTQPTGATATVASGTSTSFEVVFTPTTAGARTATISIASNDANSPYTFTLNGEGVFAANNLAAPTLFTPNGDGNNDTFIISAPTLARGNLKIFNRKGGLVFSSNDVSEITQVGWDGTYKGTALPTGTYIWQITGTFTDGTPVKRQTGEIYLVR